MSRDEPNDLSEMWKGIHEEERLKRVDRKAANLAILKGTTIPFIFRNDNDVVLVRDKGYPATDFWPTKNKWQIGARFMLGDAEALVDFLKRRAMK